jgi:hypothetical protein
VECCHDPRSFCLSCLAVPAVGFAHVVVFSVGEYGNMTQSMVLFHSFFLSMKTCFGHDYHLVLLPPSSIIVTVPVPVPVPVPVYYPTCKG